MLSIGGASSHPFSTEERNALSNGSPDGMKSAIAAPATSRRPWASTAHPPADPQLQLVIFEAGPTKL
jgi:hypothetical protein